MKGYTTTQVIVALVVGLVIIGALAYLLYLWLGKGTTSLTEAECLARRATYCAQWMGTGYSDSNRPWDWNTGKTANCYTDYGIGEPTKEQCTLIQE